MAVWTRVSDRTPAGGCQVMVDAMPDYGGELRVSWALARVQQVQIPLWVYNPIEVPQHSPLAEVTQVGQEDIQKERELVLRPGDCTPEPRTRHHPVPPRLYPELRNLLQDMLDHGVVRESASLWTTLLILVRKLMEVLC
ncbi:hypothetical protein AAFF_G00362260 [Aldrovandia affinis]|uniref:Uncharacterized protein n=1 Tax=Aldrovandia affinis TaxID=143900 RepID=A0AAD7WN13_9TELE|nr:hypothetical protein AAFF_G00362260 [Aldrovandia affinis]